MFRKPYRSHVCPDSAGGRFKADPAAIWLRWNHQLSNGVDQILNLAVVVFKTTFQFTQFCDDLLIGCERFPHAHEGAHDEDTHLNCAFGIQNSRGHDCTVFSESQGQITAAPSAYF